MIINNQHSSHIFYVAEKDEYFIARDLDNSYVSFSKIMKDQNISTGREVLELYDTFEEMRDKALEYGVSQEEINEMYNDI